MSMLKWNIFLSFSLSLSRCMHKQTQYFNCSEQVMRRLLKKKKKRLSHSSTFLFLDNQTKEERLIFSPRGKRQNGSSSFFFNRIELYKQYKTRERVYIPLSMTYKSNHPRRHIDSFLRNGIIHFEESSWKRMESSERKEWDERWFRVGRIIIIALGRYFFISLVNE
jgi:hypothetical protein